MPSVYDVKWSDVPINLNSFTFIFKSRDNRVLGRFDLAITYEFDSSSNDVWVYFGDCSPNGIFNIFLPQG